MNDQTAGTSDRPEKPKTTAAGDPGPAKPRRPLGKWIFILLGIVLLVLIAGTLLRHHGHSGGGSGGGSRHHGQSASANAGDVEPVAVATVRRGDMPVILHLIGTVVPITNVTITPRVNGHILKVYYQEGQEVKAGDDLELIDPRPYEATLAQYQGTLAADRAQLEKARVDNARYQRLIRQNSTSAMTARDQEFTVQQLEGQVKFDEANVRNAELNVMYCHITAPVAGRVGIRALDMGNYVSAGQSGGLTVLTQMQPISIIFTLPQSQLGAVAQHLREDGHLDVEAWNSDDTQLIAKGTVRALDSQINTATGTVRLRGIFPNEDEHLFPNQFVNPHLLVETQHNVLLVPTSALQTGPDGQFLYVVQPDMTVRDVAVKVGATNETEAVILSGVRQGDRVVTDGVSHLRPGAKVSIPSDATDRARNAADAERLHHERNGQQSAGAAQKSNDPVPSPSTQH